MQVGHGWPYIVFMNSAEQSVKVLGMAGEGACECCGTYCPKRRVAVLLDGVTEALWGSICAGKASGRKSGQVETEARNADDDKRRAVAEAARAEADERDAAFGSWLYFETGHTDRFLQLQAMGGMKAAREAYKKAST